MSSTIKLMAGMAAVGAALAVATDALAGVTVVGFDNGDPSGFGGNAFFVGGDGNPGGNAHHFNDSFGQTLRTGGPGNPLNSAFVGNYGAVDSVTIGFDLRVDSITNFIGNEIVQSIGIMLIDHDTQGPNGSAGVFFDLGLIGASLQSDWTHLEVTIDDTSSMALPTGWIGFGDENQNFEPVLPNGATFASILSSVDEFQITTFVPGFFFTNSFWDMRIDNVSISNIPTPGALALFGLSGIACLRRRR
jgi:hypothetical protein